MKTRVRVVSVLPVRGAVRRGGTSGLVTSPPGEVRAIVLEYAESGAHGLVAFWVFFGHQPPELLPIAADPH